VGPSGGLGRNVARRVKSPGTVEPPGQSAGSEEVVAAAAALPAAPATNGSSGDSAGRRQYVLGIDPGLNITGYGVLEVLRDRSVRIAEAGVVRGRDKSSLESRLREIFQGVNEVIHAFHPAAIAIEQLYSHYERPRTAILMGHARGTICLAAALADIPLYHYAATHVKRMLTGNGHAPKSQVQMAIQRELRLTTTPEPPDVADALAVALCHHYETRIA
jgi:crossover junction endodeoxyribonuclease RuvC